MKAKSVNIKKYDGGTKSTKTITVKKPSFAGFVKPLSKEQTAKGDSINALDKKKKLFDGGTKKIDNYTRETTKSEMTKPASKGKLYIKEGTIQRKAVGKGVDFVPKDKESTISYKGKIIDRKSNKAESGGQASLRKATLDSHKDTDLSKRYKEGDTVTYDTTKGKQVAGKIAKSPDSPAEYRTSKQREIEVSKKGDTIARLEGTKEQQQAKHKELIGKGYYKQPGTSSYIKKDESKFISESDLDKHKFEGWNKSGSVKASNAKGNIKAKGAKKMNLKNKGC